MSHASREQVAMTAAQLWAQAHAAQEYDGKQFGIAVMNVYCAAMRVLNEEEERLYFDKCAATIEAGKWAGLSFMRNITQTDAQSSSKDVHEFLGCSSSKKDGPVLTTNASMPVRADVRSGE